MEKRQTRSRTKSVLMSTLEEGIGKAMDDCIIFKDIVIDERLEVTKEIKNTLSI